MAGDGRAASAATTQSAYVVMYSDSGDYIGQGTQRFYDASSGVVRVQGTVADLQVSASGGASGDGFGMEFAAPPGDVLTPGGVYTEAQRAPFREAGHPGIDISGDGRGCNTDTGLFEVKDIATDAAGNVVRLWLVYEEHCEGGLAATWGEVSIGESVPATPLVAPALVRWPATDVAKPNTVVPVTVKAVGAGVTVTSASLTGTNPGDFLVRADECSGKPLTAGGSCQVWVKFLATAPGVRAATLRLTDGDGGTHDVTLQGFAHGGTTSATMTSDPGDYIGAGGSYSYSPAHGDSIAMGGGRTYAGFTLNGANGDWWYADFQPPTGDIIAAGSTYQGTRYPFNNGGAGLSISGNGRGCNTLTGSFTVNSATFTPDGTLATASISFVQHCEGMTPAFHGTLSYRAGDTATAAPWMIPTDPVPAPPPPQAAPTLASFTPASGQAGTTVTISGTNLSGATGVTFNGAGATFAVASATQISATVPQNATTGPIAVTTPAGTAVSQGSFTVTSPPPPPPAPVVSSVSPSSGTPGTTVTLTGSSFGGATSVSFNGASAVFNVISATQIQTSVPSGATSGAITVRTPSGTASSPGPFTVTGATPSIASFSPASGSPGTTVTITGSSFAGASAVLFNGVAAVYSVVSESQIQASVPSDATTGKVTVTTGSGSAQSASDFTVATPASGPAIASFAPTSGEPGTAVTLTGTSLGGATGVAFNGTAASFTILSATQIKATVPAGATSGPIAVTTASGTGQSAGSFTVLTPPPALPPGGGGGGGGGGGSSVPDLAVTATVSQTTLAPLGTAEIVATVSNAGGASSLQTHLVITLPASLTLVGPPYYERGSGCTGTRTIDCFLDVVLNNSSTKVIFDVVAASAGDAAISLAATGDRDSNPANNSATVTLSVAAPPQAPTAGVAGATATRHAAMPTRTVKVDRAHDTLRKIARWKLHDATKWRRLYTLNRAWFARRKIVAAKAADRRLPLGLAVKY